MYKVALIDDEHLIVEGLSRVVNWAGFGCEVAGTASDGREGLALIRLHKPDLVFTDIRMPNMDGLTMLAALRSEFPRMQVTVMTAFRDFDYAQRAINLGVCRYLLKPSKMEEINEAVSSMIARLDALGAQPPRRMTLGTKTARRAILLCALPLAICRITVPSTSPSATWLKTCM